MEDLQHKIHEAVKMEPDYSRLDTLSYDVMRKVRVAETSSGPSFQVPFFLKAGTAALCCLALLAVWQISFSGASHQSDMFDLRYFSTQADPSLTFASVNTYRLK